MPGTADGTWRFSTLHGALGHFLDAACLAHFLPGTIMLGLRIMPSSATPAKKSSSNTSCSTQLGDVLAACDVMVAVHQHFRLDDRHDAVFLRQRGIARQRLGIGIDAVVGRECRADIDHRAPFGEARAQLVIFDEALAQAVQAFGDGFARASGQRLGAVIHLDAGHRAGRFDQLDQRRAVLGLLADGFVITG